VLVVGFGCPAGFSDGPVDGFGATAVHPASRRGDCQLAGVSVEGEGPSWLVFESVVVAAQAAEVAGAGVAVASEFPVMVDVAALMVTWTETCSARAARQRCLPCRNSLSTSPRS